MNEEHAARRRRPPFLALVVGGALLLALIGVGPLQAASWHRAWSLLCALSALLWAVAMWRVHLHRSTALNTAANLVNALRKGDYSLRGRLGTPADTEDLLMLELNSLASELRADRVGRTEADELLHKVMSEIDTAVLALDESRSVVLSNPAAQHLFGRPIAVGESAEALGLAEWLSSPTTPRLELQLPGAGGPFELRVQPFRHRGRAHTLLVLRSVARLLREEERRAHRQVIRVLSHEVNNSLAPIQSLATRLQDVATRVQQTAKAAPSDASVTPEELEDLYTGLAVIARRSGHLAHVMAEYARLARPPQPRLSPVSIHAWIARISRLYPAARVTTAPKGEFVVLADEALIDQALLNLLKNAFEAHSDDARENDVSLSWSVRASEVVFTIADRGRGLPAGFDPVLPFVTTKQNGGGIGLALSREVVEAHGGRLELVNRTDGPGCIARMSLPLISPSTACLK